MHFGPQEVQKPITPSMRDMKRADRMSQREYPGIDVLPRTDLLSTHFAGQPDGRPKGKS
jgi:hypothetical protein